MTFQERWIDADRFRIRYLEAGDGPPLIHLHGAGGLRLTQAHDLLCRQFRVIVFEMPGFGDDLSPLGENQRTRSIADLASTMDQAASALGLDRFNLLGTSFGGTVALWLAVRHPAHVAALVLEAPAAIRTEGSRPVSGTPEQVARMLFAHPERIPAAPAVDAALVERRLALVRRLRGPGRDPALEERLRGLGMPVLVLFGTRDAVVSPDMGRIYRELIPGAHVVFVYDAGHAIAAERPVAFGEVTADFLERNDAFVISRTKSMIFP